MSNHESHTPTKLPLLAKLVPWAFFCCFALITEVLFHHLQKIHLSNQQVLIESYARELSALLEYELDASLEITRGMENYIINNKGELDVEDIKPWLSPVINNNLHFRNVAIAPGNTVTLVYPLAGNETVIGLHYPRSDSQWPEIETIILSRKPMMAGPLRLVQGGTGLIYRLPVYIDRHYWGLVSAVIDADSLFAQLQTHAQLLDVSLALIDGRKNPKYWRLLWGENTVMTNHDIVIPLDIPGRSWKLLLRAESTQFGSQDWIRIFGWLLAALMGGLLYVRERKNSHLG